MQGPISSSRNIEEEKSTVFKNGKLCILRDNPARCVGLNYPEKNLNGKVEIFDLATAKDLLLISIKFILKMRILRLAR